MSKQKEVQEKRTDCKKRREPQMKNISRGSKMTLWIVSKLSRRNTRQTFRVHVMSIFVFLFLLKTLHLGTLIWFRRNRNETVATEERALILTHKVFHIFFNPY